MSHPISEIGSDLYRQIAELEKSVTGFDDEVVKNWEGGEEVDPEKVEMLDRIAFLEEQQTKILSKYEHMRQTLSTVSEQVLRLKRKLRGYRTAAVMKLAEENRINLSFIPHDPEQLKEQINVLRAENKDYGQRIAKKEAKMKEEREREKELEKAKEKEKEGEEGELGNLEGENKELILRANIIIAGTIPQLLGSLLSKMNPDPSFAIDLLCVYPAFLKGVDLLQNISTPPSSLSDPAAAGGEEDGEGESPEDEKKNLMTRCFNLMKVWVSCVPQDFRDNPDLKANAKKFISSLKSILQESQVQNLIQTLERKTTGAATVTKPRIYVIPESTKWDLLDMSSSVIAKQWTLYDIRLYKLIDPRVALSKPSELLISKRIVAVNEWVKVEIEKYVPKTAIIKKFLEIMEHCRRLRNVFGVFTLFEAVVLSSRENKSLIHKGVKHLKELNDLLSPTNHYVTYRSVLEEKKLPSIPNFKFSLANFTETLEQQTWIADSDPKLLNFAKFRKAARTIQEIQFFQKSPYEKMIDLDPTMMGFVQTLPATHEG
mmetsp:Transcript_26754/g.37262  ORF Transcript_26754/g.37262 Transcript_26754/m.37262 type:complete len:543 (+) Transcript_26754:94-1722(+)|eukprot:CAMPEP_0201501442 /NCGR_PEP_ID=MMETSP0151_2-20130828/83591_1 /ASSEMBLY_ACC=CAM_ASM_000257 /TAXON_ID=200890 /ORGANISM="Paramoeba atlantica, Strain 621/1 / CCAP 1560/9" /LENGTH=542 /DNA_ID=CAMNT_0047894949 /DNA_START=819 /DNA_END=2447 /DNA_ORIENTATION=-